jgi:hypothetical protein
MQAKCRFCRLFGLPPASVASTGAKFAHTETSLPTVIFAGFVYFSWSFLFTQMELR